MIDAAARGRLRTALAQLIDGEIGTDDFTWIYDEVRESTDAGVREIGLFGWGLYSDDWNRRLKGKHALDPETRRMAERCLQVRRRTWSLAGRPWWIILGDCFSCRWRRLLRRLVSCWVSLR